MNRRILILAAGLLASAPADAQLALPGAAPAAPAGSPAPAAKPAKPKKQAGSKSAVAAENLAKIPPPGVESIDNRPLLLNGQSGLMQISGSGDALEVDKLRLPGEGVSDPSQACVVDIVGEKPIEAKSAGRPDGLDRYEVDVPACPFVFDVLNGAVMVPSQITACVFKAADCQTSPGGLWGPDAAALGEDAAAIGKRRSLAEKAMGKTLEKIEERAQTTPDAASLVREQNGFAGERDDACRSYVKEASIGFCAASLTEAREALLRARLEAFGSAKGAKAESKTGAAKTVKKKKPKTDAAAQ
jgi:hypothetical protein